MSFRDFIGAQLPSSVEIFRELNLNWKLSARKLSFIEDPFHGASTPYRNYLLKEFIDKNCSNLEGLEIVQDACRFRGYWGEANQADEGARNPRGFDFYFESKLSQSDLRLFEQLEIGCSEQSMPIPDELEACRSLALKILAVPFPSRNCMTSVGRGGSLGDDRQFHADLLQGKVLPTNELDIEVAALVRTLNLYQIETFVSCGGHGYEPPHIVFSEDGSKRMSIYKSFLAKYRFDLAHMTENEGRSRFLAYPDGGIGESIRISKYLHRLARLIRNEALKMKRIKNL